MATSLSRREFRWSLVVLLIFALQPISSRDFWWQLSCTFPSAADPSDLYWLCGTCLRWVYDFAGIHGLMFLKVVAATILATWWNRQAARPITNRSPYLYGGWLGLGLLTVHGSEPSITAFCDALGIAFVWQIAARPELRRLDLLQLFAVVLIWANSSPGVACGLLLVGALRGQRRPSPAILLSLMLIALCISPRGWRTGLDSLCHLFPICLAESEVLRHTEWAPTIIADWHVGTMGLLILTIATLPVLWRANTEFRSALIWGLFVTAGWCSQSNVALAAMGLMNLGRLQGTPTMEVSTTWLQKYQKWRNGLLAVACLWIASGFGFSTRLGWGLAAELDLTPYTVLVPSDRAPGRIIGFDRNTLGVARWLQRSGTWPSSLVQDSPQQALMEGRLRAWIQLRDDLALGKLHPYRRSDGTSGGWWQVLFPASSAQLRPHLLMVSAADTELIRALEPTLWKPLLLDAPVIPYALADDASFSKEIINALRLRDISNRGTWLPSPVSTGFCRSYFDLWGALTQSSNITESLRLARTLRAMQLPNAAAKVLFSCRPSRHQQAWDDELIGCWWDQAVEEALRTGSSSQFFDPAGLCRDGPAWVSDISSNRQSFVGFKTSISELLHKDILLLPSRQSPEEQLYAEARIAQLQGQPDTAGERFQRLVRDYPSSIVAALARWESE